MKPILTLLLALIVSAGNAFAQETATKSKVQRKVEKQQGIQKALELLQSGSFQMYDLPNQNQKSYLKYTPVYVTHLDANDTRFEVVKKDFIDDSTAYYVEFTRYVNQYRQPETTRLWLYLKKGNVKITSSDPWHQKPDYYDYTNIESFDPEFTR